MGLTRRRRRVVAVGCVVATVVSTFLACIHDNLVECGDTSCPASLVCTPGGCATPSAAAACADLLDGQACTTDTILDGTCAGGACRPIGCGNGIIERGESCDDGNQSDGDGCSADCRSDLTCGNGVTDLSTGEQCDSGIAGLSGDGCSSRCGIEVPVWRQLTFPGAGARAFAGFAADANGRMLLIGGTDGSDGSVNPPLSNPVQYEGISWHPHPGWIPDPSAPGTYVKIPQLSHASMTYDTDRKRTLVFGGLDANNVPRAEIWEWDGVTWRDRTPAVSPPARFDAAFDYDPVAHRALLVSGTGGGSGYWDDTWTWDGAAGSWRKEPYQGSGQLPPSRQRAALAYDTSTGMHVLFGGLDGAGGLSDTWTLVIGSAGWSAVTTATSPPAPTPVAANAMGYSPADGHPVLVTESGDSYTFAAGTWTKDAGSATTGSLSPFVAAEPSSGRLLLMKGGSIWSRVAGSWQSIPIAALPAQPAAAAYDAGRARGVITGTNGTWEWDGTLFTRRSAAGAPAPLTYDSVRGEVISVGAAMLAWTGTTWATRTPTTLPPVRSLAALAFDEARGQAVLFGGTTGTFAAALADTWTYDGTTWTSVAATPATRPPARQLASMAYDRKRGVVVLFGGEDTQGHPLADTWEWDGTAWTAVQPATAPPARWGAILVYDARWERLVLVGGMPSPSTSLSETWTWDGTTWTRLTTFTEFGALSNTVGFADGRAEILTLNNAAVWRLRYETPASSAERCTFANDDLDGDGLAGCADPDCWGRCSPTCPPNATCAAAAPHCGDGTCSPIEDYLLCPADCAPPP